VRRSAPVTGALVAFTVACSVAMFVLERADPGLHDRLLHTFWVVGGEGFRWWQPATSTLLHGDWLHLLGNMVFLWAFGQAVEDRFGRVGFLVLYLAGAYAAGGLHAAFERVWVQPMVFADPASISLFAEAQGISVEAAREAFERARSAGGMWSYVPAIGASGAIAAVTGAFLVLFPRTNIRCLWLLGLGVVHVPAWWLIGFSIVWNLVAQGIGTDGGVAHLAHLGGYAFGFACAFTLLALRVFPREPYDLFTVFRQAHRRRQFRAVNTEAARPRPEAAAAKAPELTRSIDELAERRAEVSRLIAGDEDAAASEAYLKLVRDYAHRPGPTTLSRTAQFRVAAYLFQNDLAAEAAEAYERFLEAYPGDREAEAVRVLLARLWGGRLGRAEEARAMLVKLIEETGDPGVRTLAKDELAALGSDEIEEGEP